MGWELLFAEKDSIDWSRITLRMDNDSTFWDVEPFDDEWNDVGQIVESLEERYGNGNGESDIMDILNAIGIRTEGC
jgi:hypothetical protein